MTADQELFEVPQHFAGRADGNAKLFQALAHRPSADGLGLGAAEDVVEGMLVGADDADFAEHREGDIKRGRAEIGDLGLAARFLTEEIIGRESEDFQSRRRFRAIEGFQALILRRQAAFRRHIDRQQNLAAIIGECRRLAVDAAQGDVVKRLGHGGLLQDICNLAHGIQVAQGPRAHLLRC